MINSSDESHPEVALSVVIATCSAKSPISGMALIEGYGQPEPLPARRTPLAPVLLLASTLSLTLLPLTIAGAQTNIAGSTIDRLALMLEGHWDTHAGPTDLPLEQRFVDRRVRIDAPEIGARVFYQQLNQRADLTLYRQRILVFAEDEHGQPVNRSYALADPQAHVDATAESLAGLTPDALLDSMAAGCEQRWTATTTGFRGYVNPATCVVISSRTGLPRAIESVNILSVDTLQLVERGYDEQGKQLFGTPAGETLLLYRVP